MCCTHCREVEQCFISDISVPSCTCACTVQSAPQFGASQCASGAPFLYQLAPFGPVAQCLLLAVLQDVRDEKFCFVLHNLKYVCSYNCIADASGVEPFLGRTRGRQSNYGGSTFPSKIRGGTNWRCERRIRYFGPFKEASRGAHAYRDSRGHQQRRLPETLPSLPITNVATKLGFPRFAKHEIRRNFFPISRNFAKLLEISRNRLRRNFV